MKRLIDEMVFSGLTAAWRRARVPTRRSPLLVKATTDGVVRPPSALGMTTGSPPSVATENRARGTTAWRLAGPRELLGGERRGPIEGYVSSDAVLPGQTEKVYVSAPGAHTARMDVPEELHAVLFLPDSRLHTEQSRGVVPHVFSREDAIFNASRCALLVRCMALRDYDRLADAMDDRWHQPARTALVPALPKLIAAAREAGAAGSALAGGGPAVLALTQGHAHAALADARTAAARDPVSIEPLFELSAIYSSLGDQSAAHAELIGATNLQPANPETWQQLGLYELQQHQPQPALSALQQALTLNRRSEPTIQAIAQARSELGAPAGSG